MYLIAAVTLIVLVAVILIGRNGRRIDRQAAGLFGPPATRRHRRPGVRREL